MWDLHQLESDACAGVFAKFPAFHMFSEIVLDVVPRRLLRQRLLPFQPALWGSKGPTMQGSFLLACTSSRQYSPILYGCQEEDDEDLCAFPAAGICQRRCWYHRANLRCGAGDHGSGSDACCGAPWGPRGRPKIFCWQLHNPCLVEGLPTVPA